MAHGGVVLVDEKAISPADIGGLARTLTVLAKEAEQKTETDPAQSAGQRAIWFPRAAPGSPGMRRPSQD